MAPDLRAVPSPARDRSDIRFALAGGGRVTCTVYDAAGNRVDRLHDGFLPAGDHSLSWQAKDVPVGVYVCELKTPGGRRSTRITRAR